MKYNVKTSILTGEIIVQEVEFIRDDIEEMENMGERLFRVITDTREQQIREALIQLGWTPPPDKAKNELLDNATLCNPPGR